MKKRHFVNISEIFRCFHNAKQNPALFPVLDADVSCNLYRSEDQLMLTSCLVQVGVS